MINFKNLTKRQKLFAVIFMGFFLLKYNFLFIQIFYVPSISGLIIKNLILILIFVYFLTPLLKTKIGRILLLSISFLFTVLFMSNYWYNVYFGNYLTISDIIQGEGTNSLSLIPVLFRQIIKPYDFIFIIDILLLIFLIPEKKIKSIGYSVNRISKIGNSMISTTSRNQGHRGIPIIVILVLILSQILFTNYLLGNKTPIKLYQENTSQFVNVYGILPLYLIETYEYLEPDKFYTVRSKAIDLQKVEHFNNQVTLKNDKPNIIVIQLESFDAKLIDYEYQGKEIAPFLNKLKSESLYFNNFFAQHVNGSFDADLSLLTSLYPVNRNYAFRENDFSKTASLPKVLKSAGYQTLAFHGNNKEFFSRNRAFPDLGFDKFYSLEDFSKTDLIMDVKDHKLGINDYDFFKQSIDFLANAKKPFFAYFITLTSHTPFYFYPEEEVQEEFVKIEDVLVRDYFQSISFLDKSLEMFFTNLKEKGMMEDTLFIIYSDHQADIDSELYSSSRDFNLNINVKPPEAIPLIIKHKDINKDIINTTGSTTDIAPTILDILGIEELPKTFMGNSLLLEENGPTLFLHENPLLLYKKQLFLIQNKKYQEIGYLEGFKNMNIQIPENKKKKIEEIIDKVRNTVFRRNGNILGGEH